MSKTRRPKREGPYLWEKLLKRKTKKKTTKAGKKGKSTKSRKGGGAGTSTILLGCKRTAINYALPPEKSLENFKKGSRAVVDDMARGRDWSFIVHTIDYSYANSQGVTSWLSSLYGPGNWYYLLCDSCQTDTYGWS